MHFNTDDLPAPVGPISALSSPAFTLKLMRHDEGIRLFCSCNKKDLLKFSTCNTGVFTEFVGFIVKAPTPPSAECRHVVDLQEFGRLNPFR